MSNFSLPRGSLVFGGVAVIAALCLLNMNGFVFMWLGIERAVSGFLFLACVVTFVYSRRSWPRFARIHAVLTLLFMFLAVLWSLVWGRMSGLQFAIGPAGALVIVSSVGAAVASLGLSRLREVQATVGWMTFLVGVSVCASPVLYPLLKYPPLEYSRFAGVYANPNEAAVVCLAGFGLALDRFMYRPQVLQLVSAFVLALAVLLTFSKTAMVGIVVLTMAALAMGVGWRRLARLTIGLLVLGSIGTIGWRMSVIDFEPVQLRRLHEAQVLMFTGAINAETTTKRTYVWAAAIEQIADNGAVVGLGLGSMRSVEGGLYEEGVWKGVHNFWLMLLGEAGVIAFAGFALFYWFVLVKVLRVRHCRLTMFGFLLAFMLDSLSSHNIFELRFHAFFLGFVIGALRSQRGTAPIASQSVLRRNTFAAA